MSKILPSKPQPNENGSGIWNETTASKRYRFVTRTGNNLTYADNNTTFVVGVTQEEGVAQNAPIAYCHAHGKVVFVETTGAVTANTFGQATTDGKATTYSAGTNKYVACRFLETVTAAGIVPAILYVGTFGAVTV